MGFCYSTKRIFFAAYKLHRFHRHIFFVCECLIWIKHWFLMRSCFFIYCQWYSSTMIQPERVCNNLNIYISYGLIGRLTGGKKKLGKQYGSLLWFYHSSPVVNHKPDRIRMLARKEMNFYLIFFLFDSQYVLCPLSKLQ